MISKKKYTKPEICRLDLDNTISLVMMSGPGDPPPLGSSKKPQNNQPFQSPFGNKPFG